MIRWRLRVLSPLHIGSGESLDAVETIRVRDRLGVVDARGAIAELRRRSPDPAQASSVARLFREERCSIGEALRRFDVPPEDLFDGPAVRYALELPEGVRELLTASRITVHEAAKRGGREPYVPGTSVKGVIRTSLLWSLVRRSLAGQAPPGYEDLADRIATYLRIVLVARRLVRDLARARPGERPRSMAELVDWFTSDAFARRYGFSIESRFEDLIARLFTNDRMRHASFDDVLSRTLDDFATWGPSRIGGELTSLVFGASPSEDILRALSVTDSLEEANARWTLYPTRVFATDPPGGRTISKSVVPEFFECLPPGAEAVVEIGSMLDEEAFAPRVRELWSAQNAWASRRFLLTSLASACRERSMDQLERETERARSAFPGSEYAEFHRALMERVAGGETFLLRMGGRNGWDMNTVTGLLGEDIVELLRSRFRLGNMERQTDRNGREYLRPFGIFPKTRQIVVRGDVPIMPLGWVEVVEEK